MAEGLLERKVPFPDRGSNAYCCRSHDAKEVLVEILGTHFGIWPKYELNTGGIERVLYSDDTIYNVNPPELMEQLRNPGGGKVYASKDPARDANDLAGAFRHAGYQARVVREENSLGTVHLVYNTLMVAAPIGFRKPKWRLPRPSKWFRKKK